MVKGQNARPFVCYNRAVNSSRQAMQDLIPLRQAMRLLGVSFGTRAAVYARIRRGTQFAVRVGQRWYIPHSEVRRLQRQTKHHREKGAQVQTRRAWDVSNQDLLATLPIAKRGRAALEAQAFLRGTIRARLRRMYPHLSRREITFKYFEEVARND